MAKYRQKKFWLVTDNRGEVSHVRGSAAEVADGELVIYGKNGDAVARFASGSWANARRNGKQDLPARDF